MPKAKYTSEARRDLKSIALWIARRDDRLAAAAKVIRDIERLCDNYAHNFENGWEVGTAMPELGPDYRTFSYKRWVIVFRPVDHGIEVMRIVDGARDFGNLFGR